ncbi:unnamed protein product [Trichogramma brassicae]|uniref:Uncharacterized protein n=1 Tax=Trichogramma brassicae TaxID=86971 RepID=A0A6H5IQ54_9HYME|nr:unnamed protein product [Trichogramma brassicae]
MSQQIYDASESIFNMCTSFSFSTTCSVARRAAASLAYVGEEREKIRLAPSKSDCTFGICLRPSAEYNRESTASLATFSISFSLCRIVTRDYCAEIRAQPRRLQPMVKEETNDTLLEAGDANIIDSVNSCEVKNIETLSLYKSSLIYIFL